MKLRNKKTGEIVEVESLYLTQSQELQLTFTDEKNERKLYITSKISTFMDEWEDYEEPKDIWWLDNEGNVHHATSEVEHNFEDNIQIGNYFKTKEEAEKAVEKLKAWKRLKDNGFEFKGTNNNKRKTGYFINYYLGKSFNSQDECEQAMKDLDLLFGGEE